MRKIKEDQCIDFLLECHSQIADMVQILVSENEQLNHLLRDLEKDIEKVQERYDNQSKISLATSLALLDLRADSALKVMQMVKNLTEAMDKTPGKTEGFFDGQD